MISRSRLALALLLSAVLVLPARAQDEYAAEVPVIDWTLVQTFIDLYNLQYEALKVKIRTEDHLDQMNARMPGMDRFRTPPFVSDSHDTGQFPFGGDFLGGLNSGDERGERYDRVFGTRPTFPAAAVAALPPTAQRYIRQAFAALEIDDSINQRAITSVGQDRHASGGIMRIFSALLDVVLNNSTKDHYLTANLDQINASLNMGNRQQNSVMRVLSHVAELLIGQTKRRRSEAYDSIQWQVLNAAEVIRRESASRGEIGMTLMHWRMP